jgi:hypothetical protein
LLLSNIYVVCAIYNYQNIIIIEVARKRKVIIHILQLKFNRSSRHKFNLTNEIVGLFPCSCGLLLAQRRLDAHGPDKVDPLKPIQAHSTGNFERPAAD